jgi:hypothetical protein
LAAKIPIGSSSRAADVGDADAHSLEKGFASSEARDLQNLEIGKAICRVERSDFDFNLSVPLPPDPDQTSASQIREQVVTGSRKKYALRRREIEAALSKSAEKKIEIVEEVQAKPAPSQDTKRLWK